MSQDVGVALLANINSIRRLNVATSEPNDNSARTFVVPRRIYRYRSPRSIKSTTWPIAAVRYQNYPACYVLLQPAYLYSKDVAACPQPSVIARHTRDDYDCRLYGRNEQIGIHGSTATDPSAIQIGEKFDDYEFWRSGITRKAGNKQESDAISRPTNLATSCYVQNYAPNLVLNLTPICTSAENATSCFVPHANGNDEKRLRPILKQEIVHAQL